MFYHNILIENFNLMKAVSSRVDVVVPLNDPWNALLKHQYKEFMVIGNSYNPLHNFCCHRIDCGLGEFRAQH